MRPIDRAKAHLKAFEPRVLEVPEWGDETGPLLVHVLPLTIAERDKLAKFNDNMRELMIEAIIMKAKDADGQPLFGKEDKVDLRRFVDGDVVDRIGIFIVEGSGAKPSRKDADEADSQEDDPAKN